MIIIIKWPILNLHLSNNLYYYHEKSCLMFSRGSKKITKNVGFFYPEPEHTKCIIWRDDNNFYYKRKIGNRAHF